MIEKVLARPITFLMLFLAIIIMGVITLTKMPIELMPNISFGEISIIYEIRGGIPPDKIESFVVKPVEEALGGVNNLKDILSISKEGRATIVLIFSAEADMNIAVMEVREKLAQVKNELPSEVEKPIVAQYEQEDIPILILGITSSMRSPEEIRKIIDTSIKDRISRIQGVANVDVFGGRERKIIIEVLPDRLRAFSISMAKVINAINRANVSLLAGDAGSEESKYIIKTAGRFESIEEIENLGIDVSEKGSIIRIKDIARIKDSYLEPTNISRLNRNQNVTVYIQKETLASTVEVNSRVLREIEKLRKEIPEDLIITSIKNDAIFINKALDSMKVSLVFGSFLAAGILLFFFKNFRLTVIVFLNIPLSILLTITLLYFSKMKLNVMTIGGLALGVGMLLDNTIVVIENIFRVSQSAQISKRAAIIKGTSQMVLPIVASTLTTIIVFLPIVFLSKDIRQLQSGVAITITFSLIASLFVALTLIPILFSRLNIKPVLQKKQTGMLIFYERLLDRVLCRKYIYTGVSLLVFLGAIIIFSKIDMNLFETEEENKFTIHVELPTGAKLEISDEKVGQVEKLLSKIPEVKTVSSKIEKWSSKIYVTLYPRGKRKRSKSEIMESLRPYFKQIQPAFIYFKESQELSAKEVFIEIYGHSYKILKELAMAVGGYMKSVPGLEDVKIRMREGRPEKLVILDRNKLATYRLTVAEVAENLHARLRGLVATRYHEKAKEIETIVRQSRESLADFSDLYRISLMTPDQNFIQLAQVADFKDAKGPSEIWRKNKKRMVQVSGSRNKISLEKAVEQLKIVLKNIKFPENSFYEFGGDYEIMLRNKRELMTALGLTIILVYLILASLFESYVQPFIIMVAVPLSFIGVVIALLIAKASISTGVIMGVIMLAGIVVNNSIILVDRINSLKSEGGTIKYIIEGCKQRLRPIFMTASTTVLGLLPLVLKGGEGSGLWRPLAITVVGGLLSSTLLVLFIVPCVYVILEKFSKKKNIIKKLTA